MWSGSTVQPCSARPVCSSLQASQRCRDAVNSVMVSSSRCLGMTSWTSVLNGSAGSKTTQLTLWSGPGHRHHGTLQSCQGLLPVLQTLLLAAVQGEGRRQRGASCLGGRCTLAQEGVQGQPCGVRFGSADQHGTE